MYKAVNISQDTYDELTQIATQLQKPKAQVVATLIKNYGKTMKAYDMEALKRFNAEMKEKIKNLHITPQEVVSTDHIDEDFASLANTDYMK